jgi:hypothetical protein
LIVAISEDATFLLRIPSAAAEIDAELSSKLWNACMPPLSRAAVRLALLVDSEASCRAISCIGVFSNVRPCMNAADSSNSASEVAFLTFEIACVARMQFRVVEAAARLYSVVLPAEPCGLSIGHDLNKRVFSLCLWLRGEATLGVS